MFVVDGDSNALCDSFKGRIVTPGIGFGGKKGVRKLLEDKTKFHHIFSMLGCPLVTIDCNPKSL